MKEDIFVPPCGIYCQKCPNYIREKNTCSGGKGGCEKRKCKGIFVCCVVDNKFEFCYQCPAYPCYRFRQFAGRWLKYGQDLMENQKMLKRLGKERFLQLMKTAGKET